MPFVLGLLLLTACKKNSDNNSSSSSTGKGTIVYRGVTYNWEQDANKYFSIQPRYRGGLDHQLLVNTDQIRLDIRFWSTTTRVTTYDISPCSPDTVTFQCRNSADFTDKLHAGLFAFFGGTPSLPATFTISSYSNNRASGSFNVKVQNDFGYYTSYPTFYNQYEIVTGTFINVKTN